MMMRDEDYRYWTRMLETELCFLTELILEVNRKSKYTASLMIYGMLPSATFSIFKKTNYAKPLLSAHVYFTVEKWWEEHDYLNSKKEIEDAKAQLFACLYDKFISPAELEEMNATFE